MKKKVLSICLIGLMMIGMVGGCSSKSTKEDTKDTDNSVKTESTDEKGEIAFIPPDMTSPYYAMIIEGAEPTAKELGYKLNVQSPSTSTSYDEQVEIMENMIAKGVKAICICTHDASSILNAVEEANEAGIPVVVFNTLEDLPGDNIEVYAYVGYDPWEGGVKSADYIAENIGEKGEVAILEGLEGANNTERIEGFIDQIEKQYKDIKIVASQAADWEREQGYSVAQNIIQANPNVKAFFAASDEMAIGAAQAMLDDGVKDIVTIGIDGNSATMESINEGVTTASLDTDPYNIGVTAIQQAVNALDGKKIEDNKVIVPCFIVDSSNVSEYLK